MTFIPNPAYDDSSQSQRSLVTNPESQRPVSETLVDITDGTDGTYYYYVNMDTFKYSGFDWLLDGGSGTCTLTIEGAVQADVVRASCNYTDITLELTGSASFTASDYLIDDAGMLAPFKYIRFKIVADTTGLTDADWTIYTKRLY